MRPENEQTKNLGLKYYAHPIWNLSLKIDHYLVLEIGKKGVEKLSAPEREPKSKAFSGRCKEAIRKNLTQSFFSKSINSMFY